MISYHLSPMISYHPMVNIQFFRFILRPWSNAGPLMAWTSIGTLDGNAVNIARACGLVSKERAETLRPGAGKVFPGAFFLGDFKVEVNQLTISKNMAPKSI